MTATTSAATKNFFGKRFLTDILENKKLLIINFALELLSLPVISLVIILITYYEELSKTKDYSYPMIEVIFAPFIMISVGTLVLSILLGFVIALFNFNYLYRKSLVDMNYSLPLSSSQRFFSDYISGLSMYMVPVIVSIIISLIILGVGSVFVNLNEFWILLPHIFKSGLIVLIGMIMLYTISVFAIVFCGSTFEAIFSILAVNALIPATICCVWVAIVNTSAYGMVGESIFYSPIFTATSPIGATIAFFLYLFDTKEVEGTKLISNYEGMYLRWMIIAIIVIAIYILAAFLLYKLRKAESVSKPYVYKSFFYAIGTMTVFCIMSLLIASSINIISAAISGIIICGIGWFIMEVIARRGFKRFWIAPISFAAVICGVFLVCGICKITDGFGAPRNVPSPLSVESVTIDVSDENLIPYEVQEISFRDKDVIKAVTAFNKDAVDRHFHFKKYEYREITNIDREFDRFDHQNVEITYKTIYGANIMREYDVMSFMLSDLIQAILCSDEYADKISENIVLVAVNSTSSSKYYTNLSMIKSDNKGGKIVINNIIGQEDQTISLGTSSLFELMNAYKKDIKSMTPEQLHENKIYCYIGEYWVLDSFTNTIDFLESREISVPPITERSFSNNINSYGKGDSIYTSNITIKSYPRFYSIPKMYFGENGRKYDYRYSSGYYGSGDTTEYSELDAITSAFHSSAGSHYYFNDNDWNSDVLVNDVLIKLLNNATPIIFNEKPIAIIHYDSNTLYLRDTAENSALLKKYYYG